MAPGSLDRYDFGIPGSVGQKTHFGARIGFVRTVITDTPDNVRIFLSLQVFVSLSPSHPSFINSS